MRRAPFFAASLIAGFVSAAPARATEPAPPPPNRGLAVVAEGDAAAPAWELAHSVYGDRSLLPPGLDEARARALVGEPVPSTAPKDVVELGQMVAAIHGTDAPARRILSGLVDNLHVKGVVVVTRKEDGPEARVFVAATGAFDAAAYRPDPPARVTWGASTASLTWSSTVQSLHRSFAEVAAAVPAVATPASASDAPPAAGAVASTANEKPSSGSRPFYASPWFWGALGAAAFAGAAFYFASRDSSAPMVQLQVQVPK